MSCEECEMYRKFIHKLRNAFGRVNTYGQLKAASEQYEGTFAGIEHHLSEAEETIAEDIKRFSDLLREGPNNEG